MKKIFLTLTGIGILIFSCKKEIHEPTPRTTSVPAATASRPPLCTGDAWQLDNLFYYDVSGGLPFISTRLVYNNKVYVFDYSEQEIRFYDGVNWDTIESPIPFAIASPGEPYAYGRNFGFTIGNKGYIGRYGGGCDPFWEYSFTSNTWTQKACFNGPGGSGPFDANPSTFAIGSKGYVVAGQLTSLTYGNETWEYDRIFDTWTKKANLPQVGRGNARGFSIGNKGYIINGITRFSDTYINLRDLLEYDPSSNTWTNKGLFPGIGGPGTFAFVIDEKAYVGGGSSNTNDFYKYDPATNSWSQMADIPLSTYHIGFSLNSNGYALRYSNGVFGMLKYTPKSCFNSL